MDTDIFSQLKRDHDQIRSLFEKVEQAPDTKDRLDLFGEVKRALTAHSKAEDQTFYTELETDEELEDDIVDARQEHELIDQLIAEVEGTDPDDGRWMTRLVELKDAVERHVREEEDQIFPLARELLNAEDADVLGKSMRQLEEQIGAELRP